MRSLRSYKNYKLFFDLCETDQKRNFMKNKTFLRSPKHFIVIFDKNQKSDHP